MDAIIGAISQLLTCVVPPLCRCIQYHRKLQENMEILKRKLEDLNSRKQDIERRLQAECLPGKLRKAEVDNWLKNIETTNKEVLEIEQKVKEVKYFSRAQLGKLVMEKIQEVDVHHQSGSFDSLVIDAPSSSGVVLPEVTLVGKTTAEKIADKIWGYLKGNEVMKIGVCGMGGAGKTTIITSINNKLVKETNKFTNVIWVYWIAEGLVDERGSMQATYDRGHCILNRLVNNCLLEIARFGSHVKMHDLIRDMTLEIISQSPMFMIKAGAQLQEFPREEEWKGNLEKVSLMKNKISKIPSNLSPNCQNLLTLLLQGNPFENIPESFFACMSNLRILDLSWTGIKDLPNSVSELRCLTTLLLNRCWKLQHIPSLTRLSSLWKLELRETRITEVPMGIELLEKLRYLDLYSKELCKIRTSLLHKLFGLKKLSIFFGSGTSRATIEEVTKLSQLELFEGHFCNVGDFNLYAKYLDSQSPTSLNYQLLVGSSGFSLDDVEYVNVNKHVKLCGLNIREREDPVCVLEEVQRLRIGSCDDIISLSDVLLFNRLDKEGRLSGKCSDLKVVEISYCGSLKNLLSPKLLQALQNLEQIHVCYCYEIEEIITSDVDEEGRNDTIRFSFPKLRKLKLRDLPKLKSICGSNGVIVCDSLQEILIEWCGKLKRLPLSLPLPAIKEIRVKEVWWESLKWDDPNVKNILQPYCRWSEENLL